MDGSQTYSSGFVVPLFRVPQDTHNARNVDQSSVAGGALTSSSQFAYLVNINIGGEDLLVTFDTGSSDLWVVSSTCTSQDCMGVPQYNTTDTVTLSHVPFHLDYLSGSVSGAVAYDTVTLAQFAISSQIFALANETTSLGLSGTGNSGILGLAFPVEAAIPSTYGATVLENIWPHLNEGSRFFAYNLGRNSSGGSFSFGQLDPAISNASTDFAYNPVYSNDGHTYDYYKLPLQMITINAVPIMFSFSASRVPRSPTPIAVLDTGTTLILGPSKDVRNFWDAVGGARQSSSGEWQVMCNRGVVIAFTLGDVGTEREYPLDPADISWAEGGEADGWCIGGIQESDNVVSGDWLLGDTFLRNVYVTHRAPSSTEPPIIGLLNLTDPTLSLQQFQTQRGADSFSSSPLVQEDCQSAKQIGDTSAFVLAIVLGFVGGALGVTLFRLYENRSHAIVLRRQMSMKPHGQKIHNRKRWTSPS